MSVSVQLLALATAVFCAMAEPSDLVQLQIDAPATLSPGGGDFVVTVGIEKVVDLVGYQLKLDFYYDGVLTEGFTVVTTAEGKLFPDRQSCSGDVPDGRAGLLLSGAVSGSGELARFAVSYDPKVRGEYYVSLRAELLDVDGRWISWRCEPVPLRVGHVTTATSPPPAASSRDLPIPVPATPLYCDVNGDGLVNILDMLFVRNMTGMAVEGRLRYADVAPRPGDSVINVLDMLAVQNYLGFADPYEVEKIDDEYVFSYDPDDFVWNTRSGIPLELEVTCTITPGVAIVGDIIWRVSNGAVTGSTLDHTTNTASATILVASADFEITVYNRGEVIGVDQVNLTVNTPNQGEEPEAHVFLLDLSKGLPGLPDRENNHYWGVFGKPSEELGALVDYQWDWGQGNTAAKDMWVTWDTDTLGVFAADPDLQLEFDPLGNPYYYFDAPDGVGDPVYRIFYLTVSLPEEPTTSIDNRAWIHADPEEYGGDVLDYTTCLVEDAMDPKLVPWNGWDSMFELSGKPEQSPTAEFPDLGAIMAVQMTPADPLVRLVIDDSGFDGLVLFDDNYEEVFRRIDLELLTDHYYVPGPVPDGDPGHPGRGTFSPIMFSSEESAAFNDKTIAVSYHNPYGHDHAGNPVDTHTYQYTVVRPDIDVDTNDDGQIVEEDDDEQERETTICVLSTAEWDEMTPAKIALRPATMQLGGEIKLKVEGDGKIRVYKAQEPHDLIMNDDVTEQDVWDFVLSGEDDILIQGIEAGDVELALEYTNGGTFRTYDKVNLVVGPDIDIDSDNDDNFSDPEHSYDDEEKIEDEQGDPDYPGKIVALNDGDVDEDGIADYADGYDLDPADPDDDTCTGLQLVPVILEIGVPADAPMWFIYYVKVRLTYDSSDPALVNKTPEGEYELPGPPEGSLRLWKKNGGETRNKASAKNGGDFVPGRDDGGEENVFDAMALGFPGVTPCVVRLFLEAVKPSAIVADKRIKFEVDLDGDGDTYDWTEDAVRVTSIPVDIDVDTNRDGVVDKADEQNESQPVVYLEASGALLLANTDSDSGNPVRDCDDATVNQTADVDDMETLEIQKLGIAALPPALSIELSLSKPEGDTYEVAAKDRVRVFDGKEVNATAILGPDAGDTVTFTPGGAHDANILAGAGDPVEFSIEGIEYGAEVVITMKVKLGGNLVGQNTVRMLVSPFLVASNLGELQRAFVVKCDTVYGNNLAFVANFVTLVGQDNVEQILGDDYKDAEGLPDSFVQDCMEIGYSRTADAGGAGYREMKVVMDLVTPHPLGPLPRQLNDPNKYSYNYGYVKPFAGPAGGADLGGNIEASPPNETWRAGRLVFGTGMHNDLKSFFSRQKAQVAENGTILEIDTSWLHAGHIDEIVSFATIGGTTKILLAAPQEGVAVHIAAGGTWQTHVQTRIIDLYTAYEWPLENIPPAVQLITLEQYNDQLWNDHLAPLETTLPAAVGMQENDVVRIPIVLMPIGGQDMSGMAGTILYPNRTNLFVRGPGAFVVGDYFGEGDPIKNVVAERLGNIPLNSFLNSAFYYINVGGVHCGTNAERNGPEAKEWGE